MSAELSDAEIEKRYNHWDENDMSRCSRCGSFISDPDVENGQARYFCKSCDCWILDYRR